MPILVYHRIGEPGKNEPHPDTWLSERRFAWQMRALSLLGYQALGLAEFISLRSGRLVRPHLKAVLLTFDDGHLSVFEQAYPILKASGFTACVFAVAQRLGGRADWDGPPRGDGKDRLMNIPELQALLASGWSVGSHSLDHSRLSGLSASQALAQAEDSKRLLEGALDADVLSFAYPYGDYDETAKRAVAGAGYAMAFATEKGDGGDLAVARRVIDGRSHLFRFLRRLWQASRLCSR